MEENLTQILAKRISYDRDLFQKIRNASRLELRYGQILKDGKDNYYLELKGEDIYLRVYSEDKPEPNPILILKNVAEVIRKKVKREDLNIEIFTPS